MSHRFPKPRPGSSLGSRPEPIKAYPNNVSLNFVYIKNGVIYADVSTKELRRKYWTFLDNLDQVKKRLDYNPPDGVMDTPNLNEAISTLNQEIIQLTILLNSINQQIANPSTDPNYLPSLNLQRRTTQSAINSRLSKIAKYNQEKVSRQEIYLKILFLLNQAINVVAGLYMARPDRSKYGLF